MSSSGVSGHHSTAKVAAPGVVTGRYGTLGEVFFLTEDFWPLNTALYVRDFKGNNPRFVAGLLESMDLAQHDGAAAVPGLNRNQLHTLPVRVPDTRTQAIVARVVESLDDLIENNRRRIEILEEMARAVYREWLVDFRYPGHEDDELVDSDLGPVPAGWELGTVESLCARIQAGGTPKRSDPTFWSPPDIDWYKTGDLTDSVLVSSSERISERALNASTARSFEPETILMAIYGSPTVGRLGLVEQTSSANQAALGLVADQARSTTEHLWFVLEGLRVHLNRIAQGAAQQNVSKAKVAEAPALIPPMEVVKAFTEAIAPSWRCAHRLVRQNHTLTALRDLLLPKLVTGQIDVSSLDLEALLEG